MKTNIKILLALIVLGAVLGVLLYPVSAKDVGKVKDVSLTVYNQNLALVREVRQFELDKGVNFLTLTGVASQIDPTSVHFRLLSNTPVILLEQNYDYDLVGKHKLLEKYIGRKIVLVDPEDGTRREVILLSIADGMVVEYEGKILLDPKGKVELPALAEGLLLKPTLEWQVLSDKPVSAEGEISYLASGMSWNADYVALLSDTEKTLDMEGWVTLTNNSGATYKNAKLKLIAGDIHRAVKRAPETRRAAGKVMMEMAEEAFREEAFFEYHLYNLQRRTTIKDRQTKQISLLTATGVPVSKVYTFDPAWRSNKVEVRVEFANSEEHGLGMPLPAGRVRVFKRDSEGIPQLIGEDNIDHTPKDEMVRLLLGYAFDIKGEKKQTDYQDRHKGYTASYEVSLRNHKNEVVEIVVPEHFPYANWKVVRSSHKWKKVDARTIEFLVKVPADGEAKLTYTVDVWWE